MYLVIYKIYNITLKHNYKQVLFFKIYFFVCNLHF